MSSATDFSSRFFPCLFYKVFSLSSPQGDVFTRQLVFEIRVFPLLGLLPKANEPHLPICKLYRWQLGPIKWFSPATKSLDPTVATVLWVGFQGIASDLSQLDLHAIVWCQNTASLLLYSTLLLTIRC